MMYFDQTEPATPATPTITSAQTPTQPQSQPQPTAEANAESESAANAAANANADAEANEEAELKLMEEHVKTLARDMGCDIQDVHNRLETANRLLQKYDSRYAILKLAVTDPSVYNLYAKQVEQHNDNVLHDPFPNAGFDLFVPSETTFEAGEVRMISMGVKCEMHNQPFRETYSDELRLALSPTGYYLYPRSSISKTPLMLANSVGIIDSGYRGNIIAALRNMTPQSEVARNSGQYTVEQGTRLVQICHPSLLPIYVYLVNESDLSDSSRGTGGFGSTG